MVNFDQTVFSLYYALFDCFWIYQEEFAVVLISSTKNIIIIKWYFCSCVHW